MQAVRHDTSTKGLPYLHMARKHEEEAKVHFFPVPPPAPPPARPCGCSRLCQRFRSCSCSCLRYRHLLYSRHLLPRTSCAFRRITGGDGCGTHRRLPHRLPRLLLCGLARHLRRFHPCSGASNHSREEMQAQRMTSSYLRNLKDGRWQSCPRPSPVERACQVRLEVGAPWRRTLLAPFPLRVGSWWRWRAQGESYAQWRRQPASR